MPEEGWHTDTSAFGLSLMGTPQARLPLRSSHTLLGDLECFRKNDIDDAEITPPRTAPLGPPFSGRTSHTHSSCSEGRWENIRSLISENVPFTRLLQAKEEHNEAQAVSGVLGRVGKRPYPPPVLQTSPLGNES